MHMVDIWGHPSSPSAGTSPPAPLAKGVGEKLGTNQAPQQGRPAPLGVGNTPHLAPCFRYAPPRGVVDSLGRLGTPPKPSAGTLSAPAPPGWGGKGKHWGPQPLAGLRPQPCWVGRESIGGRPRPWAGGFPHPGQGASDNDQPKPPGGAEAGTAQLVRFMKSPPGLGDVTDELPIAALPLPTCRRGGVGSRWALIVRPPAHYCSYNTWLVAHDGQE